MNTDDDVIDEPVASFYGAAKFRASTLMNALTTGIPVEECIRRERFEKHRLGDVVLSVNPLMDKAAMESSLLQDIRQLALDSVASIRRHGGRKKAAAMQQFHDDVCRRVMESSTTSDDELNAALLHLDDEELGLVLGVESGREINEELLTVLGTTMVGRLAVAAKLCLVCKLAPLKKSPPQQVFLERILLSTYGQDLFDLKDGFDTDQSSEMDTSRLVFERLSDKDNHDSRDRVLRHIETEAKSLTETAGFRRPLRVLSDIDDTLVHSGFGLGGPKYKPGTILPGFVPLLRSLHARVAFVTARPAFIKRFTYKTLRMQYGIPDAVCLSGELIDSVLIPFAPDYSNEKISARKLGNIERYMRVFPECDFLWFGDTGQGDLIVGEKMLANPVLSAQLKGVFIQDVVKSDGHHYKTPPSERLTQHEAGIDIVDNYLEVALALHERNLLPRDALKKVAISTAKQVRALLVDPHNVEIIVARVIEHERMLEVSMR